MTGSATITIRVTPDLEAKLARLSEAMRRSKSDIAAKALEAYVDYELPIVEGILRGMVDMAAGRVTPHDQVMDQMRAAIAAARVRREKGEI